MSNSNDHLQDDPTPRGGSAFSPELQDLLDGRLDDAAADALRARIEREPALREQWDELRGIQRLVRGYGPQGVELEPPADFLAGVQARVSALKTRDAIANERLDTPARPLATARRPGRMLRLMTLTYAAAALLVVGFTVRYVLDSPTPAGDADTGTTTAVVKPPRAGSLADDAEEPQDALLEDSLRKDMSEKDKLLRLQAKDEAKRSEELRRVTGKRTASAEGAPKPEVREALRPKDGRGGFFGGPGGAVTPGVRPPPGAGTKTRAKKLDGGLADDKPAAESADRPAPARAPAPAKTPPTPLDDGFAAPDRRASTRLASLEKSISDGAIVYVLEVDDATTARRELALLLGRQAAEGKDAGEPKGAGPIGLGGGAGGKLRKRAGGRSAADSGDQPAEEKSETDEEGKAQDGSAARTLVYRPDATRLRSLLAQLRVPAAAKQPRTRMRASNLALVDVVTPALPADALRRLEAAAGIGTWGRAAPGADTTGRDPRARRTGDKKAAKPDRRPAAPSAPGAAAPGAVVPTPKAKAPRAKAAQPVPRAPASPAPTLRRRQGDAKAVPQIRILLVERKR